MKIDSSIPGWSSRAKLVNIANVSTILEETRPDPSILEIGVWAGRSMYHWAANAPSARMVALDPGYGYTLTDLKKNDPAALDWMDGDVDKWNMWDTDVLDVRKSVLTRHDLTNVDLRIDGSTDYLRTNREKFDVIYVDGDHSTAQVYRDIAMARMALKDGGIICGDDYGWASVRQGVLDYKREAGTKTSVFEGMDMWVMYDETDIFDYWFPNVVDSSGSLR